MSKVKVVLLTANTTFDLSSITSGTFNLLLSQFFQLNSENEKQHFHDNVLISLSSELSHSKTQLLLCKEDALLLQFPQQWLEDFRITLAKDIILTRFLQVHKLCSDAWQGLHTAISLFSNTAIQKTNQQTQLALLKFIFNLLLQQIEHDDVFTSNLSHSRSQLAMRFRNLVRQNINKKITIAQLANELHLSSAKLYGICTECFGQSPKSLLNVEKIAAIKTELLKTSKPIYQIAEDFSYEDASNFSKYFIKHTQVHPSEFRRQDNGIVQANNHSQ